MGGGFPCSTLWKRALWREGSSCSSSRLRASRGSSARASSSSCAWTTCGERIPLTIADADPEAGTVTIVVQAIGKTTMLFNMLEAGDSILDIVGPLGKPSEIEKFGTTVVVSGSVGTAMAYPTARELKRAGNKVISIVGARSKDLLVLEDEVARSATKPTS